MQFYAKLYPIMYAAITIVAMPHVHAALIILCSDCVCHVISYTQNRWRLNYVTKWVPRPDVRPGGGPVRVPWWPRAGSYNSSAQPEQLIFPPAHVHFILTVLHTATIHTLCPQHRVHNSQTTDSLLARVSGLFQRS